MSILALALAALIGVSLGLLGGGGSILTVPVLVYVLGYGAKTAIAMSLPVVGVTSLVGAVMHWRFGNVQTRTAVAFGLVAMVGAFAGARLAGLLSGRAQLVLLAIIMLTAAASMLRRTPLASAGDAATPGPPRLALLAPVALGVGVLTGLVGIGGGFLIVPALVLLARVPMRQAVGTSLLVIVMNSAAGFAGHLDTAAMDWTLLAWFTAVAVTGSLAGAALARVVPQAALKRGFAIFLFAVGGYMLYANRTALTGASPTARAERAAPMADVR